MPIRFLRKPSHGWSNKIVTEGSECSALWSRALVDKLADCEWISAELPWPRGPRTEVSPQSFARWDVQHQNDSRMMKTMARPRLASSSEGARPPGSSHRNRSADFPGTFCSSQNRDARARTHAKDRRQDKDAFRKRRCRSYPLGCPPMKRLPAKGPAWPSVSCALQGCRTVRG